MEAEADSIKERTQVALLRLFLLCPLRAICLDACWSMPTATASSALSPSLPRVLSPYLTVQCSTVQYSTVQHSTVQYSTVQCSTVLRGAQVLESRLLEVRAEQHSSAELEVPIQSKTTAGRQQNNRRQTTKQPPPELDCCHARRTHARTHTSM